MPRTLNAATLRLNASTEATRTIPYDDARPNYTLKSGDKIMGTLTVGRGHTGSDVHIGEAWTMDRILAAQMTDLSSAEEAAQAALDEGHVTMNDNQFGATTDFVFNVGIPEFQTSTVRKLIVAGYLDAVPAQFNRWVYAQGKKSKGLAARRSKEVVLYTTQEPISLPAAVETSVTPDSVATPRVWSAKPVIGACVAGVSTICGYAPDIAHTLTDTASQLQPLVDYGHALKIAFLGCSLGGIALGGISGFLRHRKDASV